MRKMVKKAINWRKMAGSSKLEKKINAYLTDALVFRTNVPADECSSYAKKIVKMDFSSYSKWSKSGRKIFKMLNKSFNNDGEYTTISAGTLNQVVETIIAICRLERS